MPAHCCVDPNHCRSLNKNVDLCVVQETFRLGFYADVTGLFHNHAGHQLIDKKQARPKMRIWLIIRHGIILKQG